MGPACAASVMRIDLAPSRLGPSLLSFSTGRATENIGPYLAVRAGWGLFSYKTPETPGQESRPRPRLARSRVPERIKALLEFWAFVERQVFETLNEAIEQRNVVVLIPAELPLDQAPRALNASLPVTCWERSFWRAAGLIVPPW